jgi:hypothetical protein
MFESNPKKTIKEVSSLPLTGDVKYIYRLTTDGNFYVYNSTNLTYKKIGATEFLNGGTSDESVGNYSDSIYREGPIGITDFLGFAPRYGIDTTGSASSYIGVGSPGTSGNQEAGFILATLDDQQEIGQSSNLGWKMFAKGNAWDLDPTPQGNSWNLHFWNGSIWIKPITALPSGYTGFGTETPGNRVEISHGTSGNSGLRFTDLTFNTKTKLEAAKVLALNDIGDVIQVNVPGTQNIVSFSKLTPTTSGVVFTPNTPADTSVIYQSAVDFSMWTYTGTTYVTYTPSPTTAWYTTGTTNDAGSNKTNAIYRIGSVGIGISPLATIHAQNPLAATATINANAQVARFSRPSTTGLKWDNIAQFNLGSYSTAIDATTRLDLQLNRVDNTFMADIMTWLANGNVGVGTTNPINTIDSTGSLGVNIRSSSASTTTTPSDYTVVMSTTGTVVTLQTPSLTTTLRRIVSVKNMAAGNITVTGNIDGTTQTLTLTTKESRVFHSNGVTWYII